MPRPKKIPTEPIEESSIESIPDVLEKTIKPNKKKTSYEPHVYTKLVILNVVFLCVIGLVLWKVQSKEARLVELPLVPEVASPITSSSTPVRFMVPLIGLDAKIQQVGKTAKGKMAVPNNFTDVGWYKLGYYPGTEGNAVIAGHLDDGKGDPAVLGDLNKLKIGDMVYVLNNEGKKLEFKVTGMSLYDYNNAPLELIFGASTGAHLNIITCDGIWIPEKKIYDKRLVVFTDFMGIVEQ